MIATAERLDTFCTAEEIRATLKRHIKDKYRFQYKAAEVWKCSAPFVNAIMRGHRDPPQFMLEEMGYEKVKGYSWKPGPSKSTLLVQKKGALLEPAENPIRILWKAGDDADHERVTVGLRGSLRILLAEKYGTRIKAADVWGCSTGFVSHVLAGSKMPSEAMLADLGLEKITGYRRVSAATVKDKDPE